MNTFCYYVTIVFDPLHHFWESSRTQKTVAAVIVFIFLTAMTTIEMNRLSILPLPPGVYVPTNLFQAVNVAFTLVLFLELMSLVFVLPCSVSRSVGKQFEIMALILLRGAFKELGHLDATLLHDGSLDVVLRICADCIGALLVFVLLGFYYKAQRNQQVLTDAVDRYHFVSLKKFVALILLVTFIGIGVHDLWLFHTGKAVSDFFEKLYNVLIFSDILLVLISQRYVPTFHAIFRNSGYAVSTLIMRLSFTAPVYVEVALGIGAAAFSLGVTLAYNAFFDTFAKHSGLPKKR